MTSVCEFGERLVAMITKECKIREFVLDVLFNLMDWGRISVPLFLNFNFKTFWGD